MGQKLTLAPVYFVLGQVRFNTVLSVEQYLPTIQESLRKAGFPDFERGMSLNMNFALAPGQMPSLEQSPRFQFLNAERTAGFILEQAGMSFQTTDYDTFEPFLETMLNGLDIVHGAASLTYSERIGIRYLDAVFPKSGDKLDQYLSPTVMGLTAALTGKRELVHSISETRTKLEKTMLISRAIVYEQEIPGVAFPPELQPIILNVSDRFSSIKGLYAIIDTDSWAEDRQSFEIANLEKQFRTLKNNIGISFDLMVTDYARECWK